MYTFERTMEYSNQTYDLDKYRPSRQPKQVFYVLGNGSSAVRITQHKGRYSSAWEGHGNFLTFYGEIKPVMIILRILGVLPYSVTATGKSKFKKKTNIRNLLNIVKCIACKFDTHITSYSFSRVTFWLQILELRSCVQFSSFLFL
jgi:hypothetical protein